MILLATCTSHITIYMVHLSKLTFYTMYCFVSMAWFFLSDRTPLADIYISQSITSNTGLCQNTQCNIDSFCFVESFEFLLQATGIYTVAKEASVDGFQIMATYSDICAVFGMGITIKAVSCLHSKSPPFLGTNSFTHKQGSFFFFFFFYWGRKIHFLYTLKQYVNVKLAWM